MRITRGLGVLSFELLLFFLEDCVWGPWSTWLSCSKTCGGGASNRFRTKTEIERFGGTCSGSGRDSKHCNTQSCPGTFKIQHLLVFKGSYSKVPNKCGVQTTV